ncbi:hypothetical protein QBC42DRAFT_15092 [Cladorrhinum samala]|uniref:P-loop containing nucleoside triphosphate hydrolase protein n=1 Tax=Cladorrhinum samala TaxID=585594 RepID=A0AAV9HH87_9PEZI|nr:hypothetical protein QBC42DRAFT_15092 [Cladorrhinum samala]
MPSSLPIFAATHPRACSTAFERVFMTRHDILHCIHEPFGDAFYFGPERLSERYENDEEARKKSGFSEVTYKNVLDQIFDDSASEGKRIFIKDIIHYLLPPNGQKASIAPSLKHLDTDETTLVNGGTKTNGTQTNGNHPNGIQSLPNPTVLPLSVLRKFHFTVLIRHPRRAIPSYYRCTIPPLSSKTGFPNFMPSEAGYDELRRLFDYLKQQNLIGTDQIKITVIDADDLLDHPADIISRYCEDVGIDYKPGMLKWDSKEDQERAVDAFEKWNGFHDDAIGSTELKPRVGGAKILTREEEDAQWKEKYGEKGQKLIRQTVDANVEDYEYLKQFAVKV